MDRPKIVSRREIPIGRVTNDGRGIVNLDDGFVFATCQGRESEPTARIRIMRGLSYRLGSVGVGRTTEDSVVLVDAGTIYVTNKRLIFDGARTNTSIRLNKILSFTPYSDGVEIDKAPVNRCRPAGV